MSQRFFDPALRVWRSGMRQDAMWSVLSFGIYAVLGAIQSVAIARHLGPEGKGIVTLLTIAPTVTAWALSLSFTNANMYLSAARPAVRNALLSMSALAALAFGFGAAVLAWLLFGQELDGPARVAFVVAVLLVPVLLLKEFQSGVLIGAGHVIATSKAAIVARLLGVGLLLFGVYFLDRATAYLLVPIGMTLGYLVVVVVTWRILDWRWRWDLAVLRQELRYGLRTHIGGLSEIGVLRFDQLVVFAFLGATTLGLYSVAVLIGESLTFLGQAIALSAFSRLATYEGARARSLAVRLCIVVFVATALASIPLALASGLITGALFGAGFAAATPLVAILAIGSAFQATGRVAVGAVRARARPLLSSGAYMVGLVVTLPLLFLLVPRVGAEGAAIASLAGYVTFCVAAVGALHPSIARLRLSWGRA